MDLGKHRPASVASALLGTLIPHHLGPGTINSGGGSVPLGRPGLLVAPVAPAQGLPDSLLPLHRW